MNLLSPRTWTLAAATSTLCAFAAVAFEPNGLVVFLSDFGVRDDAVALCKGVMLSQDPALRIIDLTHDVTAFDVREGAFYLAEAARVFPPGTVFVAVVDPGVGTTRQAVVVEAEEHVFVLPDNGLVTFAIEGASPRAWELTNTALMAPHPTPTFHGRDVFSPAAAAIASGDVEPSAAGRPVRDLVRLPHVVPRFEDGVWHAEVQLLDKAYGNVWTNLAREDVAGGTPALPDTIELRAGDATWRLPLVETFGDVPAGAPLAYFNSRERLSFAINMGSFAATHGLAAGTPILVRAR